MTRVLTVCIVIAAATAAAAATPRVQALGGDGTYLEDAGNVLRWSGSLTDHAGRATVGTGTFDGNGYPRDGDTASGPWAGIQAGFGGSDRSSACALYGLARAGDHGHGGLAGVNHRGAFHGLVSHRFGSWAATLGWRRSAAAAGYRERRNEFGIGARIDLGASAYLDLAGERVHLTREASDASPALDGDDSRDDTYGVRARAFVGLTPTLVLVPVAGVAWEGRDWWSTGPAPWSVHHLRLGAAITWLPDPDRLVLASIEHRRDDAQGPSPLSDTHALLLRLALEARLNAFLSIRAATGWEDRQDPAESLAPLSCGLAVHAGDWDLDLAAGTAPPLDPAGRRPDFGKAAPAWLSAALSLAF